MPGELQSVAPESDTKPGNRLTHFLALNRTVGIVLITVLLFGLGEELWRPFLPVQLNAQTTEVAAEAVRTQALSAEALWYVGFLYFFLNLFEGFCYIGGGQITAPLGDRGSLIFFALLTITGYSIFLAFPRSREITIMATLLILGWEPLSVPVTFTTVGSTVAPARQGMRVA